MILQLLMYFFLQFFPTIMRGKVFLHLKKTPKLRLRKLKVYDFKTVDIKWQN